jgi:membrane protease YdiL (CAAX protease family)
MTLMRRYRPYLAFLPSLATGVLGAVWLAFHPLKLGAPAGVWETLLAALVLAAVLLGGAWLLERLLPSFRFASKLLERVLDYLPMTLPLAVTLAALTAVSEELFFRGALLPLIGVWLQALAFGLMHPAPLRAWSYTLYTMVAGLLLGFVTLLTGALWAAMLVHFTINFQGFWEMLRLKKRRAEAARAWSQVVPLETPETDEGGP